MWRNQTLSPDFEFRWDGSLWRYDKQMKRKWRDVSLKDVNDMEEYHRYTIFKIAGRSIEIDAIDDRLTIVHIDSELVGLATIERKRYGAFGSFSTAVAVGDKLLHISVPQISDDFEEEFIPPIIKVFRRVKKLDERIVRKELNTCLSRIIGKDGNWQDDLRKFYLPQSIMPQEIFDECEEKGWPLLDSDGVPLGLNTVTKSQHWYGNPRDVRMKQLKQESESTEASDYFHRKLQNEQRLMMSDQGVIKKQNPASRHFGEHDWERFERLYRQIERFALKKSREAREVKEKAKKKAHREKCFICRISDNPSIVACLILSGGKRFFRWLAFILIPLSLCWVFVMLVSVIGGADVGTKRWEK